MKIFFITCLLLFIGCSPVLLKEPKLSYVHLSPECQESINKVRRHFFYNKKGHHFVLNVLGLPSLFENKFNGYSTSCLNELTLSEIKDIFGKPSMERNGDIYYYLSSERNPKLGKYYCLVFSIGQDQKTLKVDTGFLGD